MDFDDDDVTDLADSDSSDDEIEDTSDNPPELEVITKNS